MLPSAASAQLVISTITYTSGQTLNAYSTGTISTSGAVVVNSGANIGFVSYTHVSLGVGFKVNSGGLFRAQVNGADTDGDGMPDVWELANGLNPAVNDAASDLDGDGLSNLLEYQLGTDPNNSSGSNTTDSSNQTQLNIHRPTP